MRRRKAEEIARHAYRTAMLGILDVAEHGGDAAAVAYARDALEFDCAGMLSPWRDHFKKYGQQEQEAT